jgi:hypothetical protein
MEIEKDIIKKSRIVAANYILEAAVINTNDPVEILNLLQQASTTLKTNKLTVEDIKLKIRDVARVASRAHRGNLSPEGVAAKKITREILSTFPRKNKL